MRRLSLLMVLSLLAGCDEPVEQSAPDTGDAQSSADVSIDTHGEDPDSRAGLDIPSVDTSARDIVEDSGTQDSANTIDAIPLPDGTGDLEPPSPTLSLERMEPNSGPPEGGNRVRVFGTHFDEDTEIYLGAHLATEVLLVDAQTLDVVVPSSDALEVVDVKAIGTLGSASLPKAYSYVAELEIRTIEPRRAPTPGGVSFVLTGNGFRGDETLSVGGRPATDIVVSSPTRLSGVLPAAAPGPRDLRITNATGTRLLRDAITYYTPLKLDLVFPAAARTTGGELIHLLGQGFEAPLEVSLGGKPVVVEAIQPTELRIRSPRLDAGLHDVRVETVDGAVVLPDAFRAFATLPSQLSLTRITPNSGPTDGGTRVVITGSVFDLDVEATLGGAPLDILETLDTGILALTPPGSQGPADLVVSQTGGSQTLPAAFTYTAPFRLERIQPKSGPLAGGERVRIHGAGFTTGVSVRFGLQPAMQLTIVSDTELDVVVPPGAGAGWVSVTLTQSGQEDFLLNGYYYTEDLSVTSLDPAEGSEAGNTLVTLTGTGFTEDAVVLVDDVEAFDVQLLDPYTLRFRTPPHESATVDVTVLQGEEAQLSPVPFTYFNPKTRVGGGWGGPINGTVNVAVLNYNNRNPIENALVMLSTDNGTAYQGFTNPEGLITFSGDDLSGVQTIVASRVYYSSEMILDIDARHITLYLSYLGGEPPPEPPVDETPDDVDTSSADVAELPETTESDAEEADFDISLPDTQAEDTSPAEDTQPPPQDTQPPPPPPTRPEIYGTVTGADKVALFDTRTRHTFVVTTREHPFWNNPYPGGQNEIPGGDGEYRLVSRMGDVAVVAVCGLLDEETGTFEPRFMGIRRFLLAVNNTEYEVHLRCDIPLNKSLTFKLIDSPLGVMGADVNRVNPYLDLGPDGYLGDFFEGESRDDTVVVNHLPALEGVFYDQSYTVIAGTYRGRGLPYSRVVVEDITEVDSVIPLGPMLGIAALTTPQPAGTLYDKHIEWEIGNQHRVDIMRINLRMLDPPYDPLWRIYLPGSTDNFNLPDFLTDSGASFHYTGRVRIDIEAVQSLRENYDYNNFNLRDFRTSQRRAWSYYQGFFEQP